LQSGSNPKSTKFAIRGVRTQVFFESDASPDPRGRNSDPNPVCKYNYENRILKKILLTYLTNQRATTTNFCF